ncbi:aldehyde dehydrogenase family protein [Cordyceps javanica]|uniref:Aldehyde dehydrogenase family protein n=1 Tax=Cordyceps javanica TaxID=43265 RepID=A0A545W735_9HYPO|nr:aldehyde dehydrogenase family protein [Cordyceps javanica]TQW09820.1 aldehyde dehydrogenase family protein [Cordyceps javanica]
MATESPHTVVPLLIDGKEEAGAATFDVVSPYTGAACWSAAAATERDAVRAVDAAAAALPGWSRVKPAARRDVLLRAADILESRLEESAAYMRAEMGADVGASQFFVVPLSIRMLRDVAGRIASICGSVPVVEDEGRSAMVLKEPVGVVLGIVPWNAPYVFGIRSAACALAAGNTTVLKPSELSPRSYWAIGRAFQEAGLPPGCLNIVSCAARDAPAVVDAMIAHPAVRKVNFTGSTAVGRKVAESCGRNLKPCLMELGGKNSAIVCADADLELAANSIVAGSFLNSGQICMSTDRIIVHASVADRFFEALKKAADQADKNDDSSERPTLVSAASKARVDSIISSALSSGARVLLGSGADDGGHREPGIRTTPTILDRVDETMPVWNDETFAPLAACMTVEDDDQAVAVANRGGYGLSAAVFTEDLRKGLALARKIESGMTIHDEPALPHGGVKNSGWGRFNANMGLDEFLVTKTVTWKD